LDELVRVVGAVAIIEQTISVPASRNPLMNPGCNALIASCRRILTFFCFQKLVKYVQSVVLAFIVDENKNRL